MATVKLSELPLGQVVGNIAPTATTGASQAGRDAALIASDAIASTDTAGAAAGGAVSIVTGDAARNTSGNANGGNHTVTLGKGIGSGNHGQMVVIAETDSTNKDKYPFRVVTQTTGTPGAGIGAGVEFAAETQVGVNLLLATMRASTVSITGGTEEVEITFGRVTEGAISDALVIGAGSLDSQHLQVGPGGDGAGFNGNDGIVTWVTGGENWVTFSDGVRLHSNGCYGFVDSTDSASGTLDTAFGRKAPGVSEANTGYLGSYAGTAFGSGVQTVAELPSAATAGAGARSFVSDASATTFLSTVSGGGANGVPVVSNGTNWLIG